MKYAQEKQTFTVKNSARVAISPYKEKNVKGPAISLCALGFFESNGWDCWHAELTPIS
jgi:hypothetical protein